METSDRQKLQQLFQFDLWCTRKLADFLIEAESFEEYSASKAFLSHIINAQVIWFHRVIAMEDSDAYTWKEYPIEEIKDEAKSAHKKWLDLIGDHEVNLDTVIHYQNSKGASFKNPLWQICHHLIIHGQHHRAQISLLLRKSEIVPPPIDYIHYTRLGPSSFGN
jgi:uncharacterized damage-inducible protein DinB